MTTTAPIPAAVGAPSQIAAATQQHREGTAIDLAAVLRRLAVGSRHAGLVVGNTPDGRPQVSIDSALLTLDGVASLPTGTRVAVKIIANAPSLAIELTVRDDGGARALVPAAGTAGATATAVAGTTVRPAPAPIATTAPTAATSTTATSTTATATATTTATAASSRNSSAPVALDKTALAPAPAPSVTLLTPMTWRTDTSGDDPAAPVQSRTLPAGTQLAVRVSLVPEATAAATPKTSSPATAQPPLAPGRPLEAVVSTVLPDGRAIVSMADGGALVLSRTADLVPGTRLTLVPGDAPASAWPQPQPTAPAPLDAPWTSLRALSGGLDTRAQAQTLKLLGAALPRPDGQMGARIHALLAAARGGDPREFLGDDAVERLARKHPEVLAGIVRDLERTAAAAEPQAERQAGCAWTAIDLPLLVGTAIEPLRLLLRHRPPHRRGEGGDPGGGHFVVEVTLRRLGRIQLDTMVRQGTPGPSGGAGVATRLDIMVRSERPLDATARQDIRDLACAAGECTGVRVGVGFQAGPAGFVDVPSQRATGSTGDLIV